jgi:glycosyltransferase involved in cell wall biosynthesis
MHDSAGPGLNVTPVKATLIIPALNEADAIGSLLRRVPRGMVAEVIVVDNGSTDATGSIAVKAAAAGARIAEVPVSHAPRQGDARRSPARCPAACGRATRS